MTMPLNRRMKRKVERERNRMLKKVADPLYLLTALKRTNKELEIAERERLMFKNERNMSYQENERLLKRNHQLEEEREVQEEKVLQLQEEVEGLKAKVEEKGERTKRSRERVRERLEVMYPRLAYHPHFIQAFHRLREKEQWVFESKLALMEHSESLQELPLRPFPIKSTRVGTVYELEVSPVFRLYFQQADNNFHVYGLSTKKNGGSHAQDRMIQWLRTDANAIE